VTPAESAAVVQELPFDALAHISSSAATHSNMSFVAVMVWNIFEIPEICSSLPPSSQFVGFRQSGSYTVHPLGSGVPILYP